MKEQGSVLVSALFVMMLLLLLGGMLIRLVATELEISRRFSDGISAYYAAEAGVKRVLVELDKQTVEKNFTEVLKNCNYRVAIKDGGSKELKRIIAAGTCNGAVRKAEADVLLAEIPPFACFSGQKTVLRAKVCGGVGLRGHEITIEDGGSIVDLRGDNSEPQFNVNFTIPTIRHSFNEKKYNNAQRLSNVINGGTYHLAGIYFVDGDFAIRDATIASADVGTTIFVKGKAELSGTIDGNITLISTDMVTINSTGGSRDRIFKVYSQQGILLNQSIEGQALLMSKGDIRVCGSLYGAVITEGNALIDSRVEGSVLAEKMIIASECGSVKYDEYVFSSLGLTCPQVIKWDF